MTPTQHYAEAEHLTAQAVALVTARVQDRTPKSELLAVDQDPAVLLMRAARIHADLAGMHATVVAQQLEDERRQCQHGFSWAAGACPQGCHS